jgi:cell division septum initiation protein DivIVA
MGRSITELNTLPGKVEALTQQVDEVAEYQNQLLAAVELLAREVRALKRRLDKLEKPGQA